MLQKLSEKVYKIEKLPINLIFLGICLIINLCFYVLGNQMKSAGASGPLDLEWYYSPEKAYQMIESYGEKGRANYVQAILTLDMLYPIAYGMWFSLLITFLLKNSLKKYLLLNLSPFSVSFFDYIENILEVSLVLNYPARINKLALVASNITSLKWLLLAMVVLLTLVHALIWFRNKIALSTRNTK